uniref:Uncharacterized protein n=1 Tax=Arundo donax TaxID=35708 RepID=A0A0A9GSH6_ARUDO
MTYLYFLFDESNLCFRIGTYGE